MKTSMIKLFAAFAMVAAMVGCASTGGVAPEHSSNDLVYDSPFQIG